MDTLLSNQNFKEYLLRSYLGPYQKMFSFNQELGGYILKSKDICPVEVFEDIEIYKNLCLEIIKDLENNVHIILYEESTLPHLEETISKKWVRNIVLINLADPRGADTLQDIIDDQLNPISDPVLGKNSSTQRFLAKTHSAL